VPDAQIEQYEDEGFVCNRCAQTNAICQACWKDVFEIHGYYYADEGFFCRDCVRLMGMKKPK
jgi:hypothetical protein